MAQCKFCDYISVGRGLFKHQWDVHHDIMEQCRQDAIRKRQIKLGKIKPDIPPTAEGNGSPSGQQPDNNGNNSKPQPQAQKKPTSVTTVAGAKFTSNIGEAVSLSITPRAFTMDSSMVWAAMEAAKREWHWPANMTPQEFLDTYLFLSYKQRGLLLGAYTVLWPQFPDVISPDITDNNGNGNGHSEAESDEYGQKEPDAIMASF